MFMLERTRIIGNILNGVLCISLSVSNYCAPLNNEVISDADNTQAGQAVSAVMNDEIIYGSDIATVTQISKEQFVVSKAINNQRREMLMDYVSEAAANAVPTPEEQGLMIADIAEDMVGTPYQYAGESQSGVDCSGLVVYCYAQMGIDLPHSSYSLCSAGTEVSIDDIRPGDIICWDNQGGSCGHVGIYIGDGMMVDARGHSDGVIYGDLDLHPILTVRRIFTD